MTTSKTIKTIILDRDGVINRDSANFVKSPDEWIEYPDSISAIVKLQQADFLVVIATNQSGLARKYFDLDTLNAMHAKMNSLLKAAGGEDIPQDHIFFCPHHPDHTGPCDCRKPQPGMMHKIEERFGTKPEETAVIGDSCRDLEAAEAYGAALKILVLTGKGSTQQEKCATKFTPKGFRTYANLTTAADALIAEFKS